MTAPETRIHPITGAAHMRSTPSPARIDRRPAFAATHAEAVLGMLRRQGESKSVGEMDAAVLDEARRDAGD